MPRDEAMTPRRSVGILALLCVSLVFMPLALTPQRRERQSQDQVIINTERITDLERRMDSAEKDMAEHKRSTTADPTNIAVIQQQIKTISDVQEKQIAIAGWALGGIGTLILGCIGVLLKRWATRFKPPEWAREDRQQQEEYRNTAVSKMEDIEKKADASYKAANEVNEKIEAIGQKLVDSHRPK